MQTVRLAQLRRMKFPALDTDEASVAMGGPQQGLRLLQQCATAGVPCP